jgi:hypothetical protein
MTSIHTQASEKSTQLDQDQSQSFLPTSSNIIPSPSFYKNNIPTMYEEENISYDLKTNIERAEDDLTINSLSKLTNFNVDEFSLDSEIKINKVKKIKKNVVNKIDVTINEYDNENKPNFKISEITDDRNLIELTELDNDINNITNKLINFNDTFLSNREYDKLIFNIEKVNNL